MARVFNYIKATWFGFITLPVLLIIIQFLARELHLTAFGVIITLYKGHPIAINYIVRWLLLIEKEAMQGYNLISVVLAWCIGWIVIADWVRDIDAVFGGIFLTYFAYILYLSWYHHYAVIIYFPESFYQVFASLIVAFIASHFSKKRRGISLFERLDRAGIKVPETYKRTTNVPIKCPVCGVTILSNAKYCWKCGKDLEKN